MRYRKRAVLRFVSNALAGAPAAFERYVTEAIRRRTGPNGGISWGCGGKDGPVGARSGVRATIGRQLTDAVRRPGRLPRTEPDCLPAVAMALHEPDFLCRLLKNVWFELG
jgi:hypothetical protein